MTYRVFIVEDHPIMRASYAMLCREMGDVELCGAAETAEAALTAVPEAAPDLVVVDVSLPGMDGIELVPHLLQRQPDLKVLVISGYAESAYARSALQAGACGFVMKGNAEEMMIAMRKVLQSGFYLSKQVREQLNR